MVAFRNLWKELCAYSNLELAFKKARKHKTQKPDVIEFEKDLEVNLQQLRIELLFHSYHPKPLQTFILRDPKTRKISKASFRDRVVHHALCNVIEPFFETSFIYDSYANRKGKGTLKAIQRFEFFSREVSHNFTRKCLVLKADIKHYFENVEHKILLLALKKKIRDPRVFWLIKKILSNYSLGKGMPLGNLTSQFFANIYLNELDQFVKQELKVKYYIRYVDDFLILHDNYKLLYEWNAKIKQYLNKSLSLELHPDKTKIFHLNRGVEFLGFKVYLHFRLLKRRNKRMFQRRLKDIYFIYDNKKMDYDSIYNFMEGWIAYARLANTYKLRKSILTEFEQSFSSQISSKEIIKR